jgi:hypothetical protein
MRGVNGWQAENFGILGGIEKRTTTLAFYEIIMTGTLSEIWVNRAKGRYH